MIVRVSLLTAAAGCAIGADAATPSGQIEGGAPQQAAAQPPAFNPFQGMERNGLIPKAKLPDDVNEPERWRYIPEGRIKPGNVLQRFMVTSFASPIVYYEEAVGAGGGLSLTDIDFRERRRREFLGLFAAHSTLGQEQYSLVWQRWLAHRELPTGGVIEEERTWLRGVVGYNRTLTRRFFGFGPDSRKSDETSYTDESAYAEALYQASLPKPGDDTVLTLGLLGQHHNLAAGRVPNRPNAQTVYPGVISAADGNDSLWATVGLRYDTRDSQHNAYRGWATGVTMQVAPLQDNHRAGAVGEWRTSLVIPVPGLFHSGGTPDEENPPTDVIAVGGFLQWTMGDVPFFALPSLGGPYTLRGYLADRFTDRAAWHASAEYRFWVIPRGFSITDSIRVERLGLAPFYDIGTVAPDVPGLADARAHHSYGIGLRATLERTALFRCDFGWSKDQFAVNVAYGLSF